MKNPGSTNTVAPRIREGELHKGDCGSLTQFSLPARILLSWQGRLELGSVVEETFHSASEMHFCAKVSFYLYS